MPDRRTRLWSAIVTAGVALALGLAVAPSVVHPRHDPPVRRDPLAGLIVSEP